MALRRGFVLGEVVRRPVEAGGHSRVLQWRLFSAVGRFDWRVGRQEPAHERLIFDTCSFLITGRCRLVDFLLLVMVTSLSIQNISVALSATAVFITLHFSPDWVEQHGACEEFSHSSQSTPAL